MFPQFPRPTKACVACQPWRTVPHACSHPHRAALALCRESEQAACQPFMNQVCTVTPYTSRISLGTAEVYHAGPDLICFYSQTSVSPLPANAGKCPKVGFRPPSGVAFCLPINTYKQTLTVSHHWGRVAHPLRFWQRAGDTQVSPEFHLRKVSTEQKNKFRRLRENRPRLVR